MTCAERQAECALQKAEEATGGYAAGAAVAAGIKGPLGIREWGS